ncbi:pantoate--beta-alanine ligase [Terrimonas rubra]|uniref:Pantothenate synthetase n=1 Tax=Terrimonas rubra TaxID=1035890 RepID=A0ABW6A7R0_9BACT
MIVFKKIASLQQHLQRIQQNGGSVGFVPTMGALHQGHIQLTERSIAEGQFTVCSIFVNPTQFNDKDDFAKYPITVENDIVQLEAAGVQALFLPSVEEIYPNGTALPENAYPLGFLDQVFEAAHRPGHFQGVCQVVHRLLDIVQPDKLYMGQKDYQQCMVIRKLLDLTGLDTRTELIICPTMRETDGLAMSSRNRRLPETDRQVAPTIYELLQYAREKAGELPLPEIEEYALAQLTAAGFKPDYFAFARASDLQPVGRYENDTKLIVVVAAFLGQVRLIDNILL